MKKTVVSLLVVSSFLIGCGRRMEAPAPEPGATTEPTWRRVMEGELDPVQRDQLRRAVAAQQEMAHTMMAELRSELETGGPAGAILVCRDLAPMIADAVSTEHGLAIGRTSHRLRNPSNTGPEWVSVVVDEVFDEQATFAGPGGVLGVTLPIRTSTPCLACHGPSDQLNSEVQAGLAESYPDDRAVDFAEGDLRGWFWVEVPGDTTISGS
jgi:hypothetical protein